jgi:membrane protease YdiL (CAAX protease family)
MQKKRKNKRLEKDEQETALNNFHWGILILVGLSFIIMQQILSDITFLQLYPSLLTDAPKLRNMLLIGTILYVFPKFLSYLHLEPSKNRRNSRKSRNRRSIFVIPKIKLELSKPGLFITTVIIIILIIFVQIIAYIAQGQSPQFNVGLNIRVYQFFTISAIAEELIFRLGISETLYKILRKLNINEIVAKTFSSILSTIAFGAIHTNYYDQPFILGALVINGFILSFALLQSKYELPVMIGHIVNNIIAAKELVQRLGL